MQIGVLSEAARRIRVKRGRLFLWQEPVGRAWVRDRISFDEPPRHLEFKCDHVKEIDVCVAFNVPTPRNVDVKPRRRPFRGVRVYVDGKRWGWRGAGTDGATGFADGGLL